MAGASGLLRSFIETAVVALLLSRLLAPACAGEYLLARGDILDFAVAGAPDMSRKEPIDVDGMVSLPLVGEIKAAGHTITSLRMTVRNLIGSKEYRQHTGEAAARTAADIVWPDQVSLEVAEYRPVYLNGDVAKPGAQPFRVGMSVRQALSLAGGYDILRFRMENPFLVASDIRGAYESAWIEFAREQSHLKRIRAELGEKGDALQGDSVAPPISPALLEAIDRSESAYEKVRETDFAKQRSYLLSLIDQDSRNIDVLSKLRDADTGGSQYDEAEFSRIQSLYKVGTLPITRVADARRVMLLSATQALQAAVELERAKTDKQLRMREADTFYNTHQLELMQAEQDSQTKLANIRVQIQANADKLLYTGALKTQLARGTGGRPDLVLFRDGAAGVPVDEYAEMKPGDVVEVALHIEGAIDAPTR